MTNGCDREITVTNRLMRCPSCKRFKCRECLQKPTHYPEDIMPMAKCDYCPSSGEDGTDVTAHRDPVEGAIAAAKKGVGSLAAQQKEAKKAIRKANREAKKNNEVEKVGREDFSSKEVVKKGGENSGTAKRRKM
jgi:hypothetical protein